MDVVVDIVAEMSATVLRTKLNKEKCKAYVAARSHAGDGPDPPTTSIEQVEGGLPALGAAHGGTYETILGPYSVASELARKRLKEATDLASECANLLLRRTRLRQDRQPGPFCRNVSPGHFSTMCGCLSREG